MLGCNKFIISLFFLSFLYALPTSEGNQAVLISYLLVKVPATIIERSPVSYTSIFYLFSNQICEISIILGRRE